MSTNVKITVSPLFISRCKTHLDNVARDSAEEIKDIAKDLAPVASGALRASIETIKLGVDYEIGSDLPYASMVEYGTAHQSPQPFMRPALARVVSQQKN